MTNPGLINERQAAQRLGLAVQTLRNWRSQGRGPEYIRFGRAIRYNPQALQNFEEVSRVKNNG